ncbi:hypothetical protein V8C86DRAFT_2573531 [Haematococcus lacustris]
MWLDSYGYSTMLAWVCCAVLATHACAAVVSTSPDMTEAQWRAKCDTPELLWLMKYMRWAKQERSKGIPEAGVKYLVWNCELPPGKKLPHVFCHGLADRLRGILMALRIAVATGRLLLVHQTTPAALQHFLVPHLIDWGVRAEELPDLQQRVMHTTYSRVCDGFVPYVWDNYSCALYTMIANGSIHNLTTQFLFVEMNDNPTQSRPGLVDLLSSPLAKHCAFTALFAASPATIEAADRHLALLGMRDAGVPFTVLHLRLGGSLGEAKASYHKDPVAVEEVVEAVACAKAFAKAFSRHPTPGMTSLEKMNTSKLVRSSSLTTSSSDDWWLISGSCQAWSVLVLAAWQRTAA